jgi:hypothetical protein
MDNYRTYYVTVSIDISLYRALPNYIYLGRP